MPVSSKPSIFLVAVGLLPLSGPLAAEPPVAIFHAFNDSYASVESYVCDLPAQGYSHVQIAPAQKSDNDRIWSARYRPVDFSVIGGMGTEIDLKNLTERAHGCGVKVIADVVFNHMSNHPDLRGLDKFPGLTAGAFHPRCDIQYGNRDSVVKCWVNGDLPDLNHDSPEVRSAHLAHLRALVDLGVDGFRFDAAKHMPPGLLRTYVDFLDRATQGNAWSYLDVVEDDGTSAEDYRWVAPVTDFVLYRKTLLPAFLRGGDIRALRSPHQVNDVRSVTFGRRHDTVPENAPGCVVGCLPDASDAYLATAYVLARQSGIPLVLNWDSLDSPIVRAGVKFHQMMVRREKDARNVTEKALKVFDDPNLFVMERGAEGFLVLNKGSDRRDLHGLDMTATNLEGCYREVRTQFTIAVERRAAKKYVTRMGRWSRGGLEVQPRDALFFVKEPMQFCG